MMKATMHTARAVLIALALLCAATPPTTAHPSALSPENADDQVLLLPSSPTCDLTQQLTVTYQRTSNTRDPLERTDFVGLFRKSDPTTLSPLSVGPTATSSQTGEIKIRCQRAGEMELRMIRLPATILGRAPLTVFPSCPSPTCSNHGKCEKGVCTCGEGWTGEGCELMDGEGVALVWDVVGRGEEFYVGGEDVVVRVVSEGAKGVVSSGLDAVSVHSVKHPSVPVASVFIPEGQNEVAVPLPHESGEYLFKLTRGADGASLATSQKFGVYNMCPSFCSYHGTCKKGTCVCNSGYDREDCSRGPGVVSVKLVDEAYTGQIIRANFTRDETVPGVLTDRDWIGIYKVTEESTDNPEYFGFAVADRSYDPDVIQKKKTNDTTGIVQLMAPAVPGQYILRYVREDHAKYFTTSPFTVYVPCANNCSSRAACRKGICECGEKWTGDDCSQGVADFAVAISSEIGSTKDAYVGDTITVNFTRPVGNNTNYDFIGVYDAASANNSHLLLAYAYAVPTNNNNDNDNNDDNTPQVSGVVELPLTADGQMTIRYVNAYTLETETEIAKPFSVYHECANNCSGKGECERGVCKCNKDWKGEDCSMGAGIIELHPISDDGNVVLAANQIGFKVSYKRPVGHFNVGDFIALFPEDASHDVDKNVAYAYARSQDEGEIFLILGTQLLHDRKANGQYVLKYFSAAHKDLGTSTPFSLTFENSA